MKKTKKNKWFLLSSLLCACSLSVYLIRQEYLVGWDGYYYALRAQQGFDFTAIKQMGGNLVYLFLLPFTQLGLRPETALGVWTGVATWLYLYSLILFTSRLYSSVRWFVFTWAALSPSLLCLSVSFPKMFVACIFLNFLFFFTFTKRLHIFAWLLCAGAAVLFHRVMVYYVLAAAVLLWIRYYKTQRKRLLGWGGVSLFLVCIYQLFWPHSIQLMDLARLDFRYWTPGVFSLFTRLFFSNFIKAEVACTVLGLGALFWAVPPQRRRLLWIPFFLCLPCFSPTFGIGSMNFGERLGLLLPYCAMLSVIVVFSYIHVPAMHSGGSKRHMLGAALLALGILFRPAYLYPSAQNQREILYHYDKIISALPEEPIPLLVAHKDFAYYYIFKTGRSAIYFEPEEHLDKTQIWHLFMNISSQEARHWLSPACQTQLIDLNKSNTTHSPNAFLLREDCYVQLIQDTKENGKTSFLNRFFLSSGHIQHQPSFLR